jgi:hypothetical protein
MKETASTSSVRQEVQSHFRNASVSGLDAVSGTIAHGEAEDGGGWTQKTLQLPGGLFA